MKVIRPRISMLTILLLLTIIALSVTLWQTGYEVMPLRTQAKNLRRELGQFLVEDSTKIHARGAQGVYSRVWKWQLYLPVGRSYVLNIFEGQLPEIPPDDKQGWLKTVRNSAKGFSGDLINGQYSVDVSLEQYDGKWWCRYGYMSEIKATYELKPNEDWLKDLLKFTPQGDVGHQVVSTFAPDEPVILLHLRRGKIQPAGDDWEVEEQLGTVESLVIWIE